MRHFLPTVVPSIHITPELARLIGVAELGVSLLKMSTRFSGSLLILAYLLLCGCQSLYERNERLHQISLSLGSCVLHRCKLQKVKIYRQSDKICILYGDDVYKAFAKYPNVIPINSDRESSKYFYKAEEIFYCPICEQALQKILDKI